MRNGAQALWTAIAAAAARTVASHLGRGRFSDGSVAGTPGFNYQQWTAWREYCCCNDKKVMFLQSGGVYVISMSWTATGMCRSRPSQRLCDNEQRPSFAWLVDFVKELQSKLSQQARFQHARGGKQRSGPMSKQRTMWIALDARRGRRMCRMLLERNNGWWVADQVYEHAQRRALTCPGMYHVHTPSSPLFKAQSLRLMQRLKSVFCRPQHASTIATRRSQHKSRHNPE